MSRAFVAGVAYFTIAFGLGFVLGSLRVMLVEPRIGPFGAVLIEIPIMLVASWVVCRWLIDRLSLRTLRTRLAMGAWAFTLLQAGEFALSTVLFGGSPATYLESLLSTAGLLGLAAQIAFGAFPVLRSRRDA